VRGITARTQKAAHAGSDEYDDEGFRMAMQDFKGIFSGGGRKSVPKAKTLLLTRETSGALQVWYDDTDGKKAPVRIGGVRDERIGRQLLMGYLAGKTVSSEDARRAVVDSVMEYVERPIGTVSAQVV